MKLSTPKLVGFSPDSGKDLRYRVKCAQHNAQ